MSNKKSGKVVTARIHTIDCMGVIDVCNQAGYKTEGMSFPAIVSQAIKVMVAGYKRMGIIPNRSGFDYAEMMQPFMHGVPRSDAVDAITANVTARAISEVKLRPGDVVAVPESNKELKAEFLKLADRRETLGFDHPNWTPAEQYRYEELDAMDLWGNLTQPI